MNRGRPRKTKSVFKLSLVERKLIFDIVNVLKTHNGAVRLNMSDYIVCLDHDIVVNNQNTMTKWNLYQLAYVILFYCMNKKIQGFIDIETLDLVYRNYKR